MKKGIILLTAAVFLALAGNAFSDGIGLAWVGKSGMAKRVVAGFEQGAKEFFPDLEIEYAKELASLDDLGALVEKWEKEKKGMVILRSNGAKWLGKNPPSIPTFIGGCNHPVVLGALGNMEEPEGMITGVTYFVPTATQFEVFKAIVPDLSSVALLLEKGHPSSVIDRDGTKKVCAGLGIKYNEVLCATTDDAISGVKEYASKTSAIIIGNQALNIDNAANIVAAAGNTPVLSYSNKPVQVGALGGFVADDGKLGYMLAESVADVLKNGKAVKAVPVKVDPDPKFYVNITTAQKLGLEIPYQILKVANIVE